MGRNLNISNTRDCIRGSSIISVPKRRASNGTRERVLLRSVESKVVKGGKTYKTVKKKNRDNTLQKGSILHIYSSSVFYTTVLLIETLIYMSYPTFLDISN